MTSLHNWALKWGVSLAALEDLRATITRGAVVAGAPVHTEAENQNQVRLEAAELGGVLWRNNVGAAADSRGNFIRYGLCNDTAALNRQFKSSDLIGIKPVKIEPYHVGMVLGQFCAREIKRTIWAYTGTARERAQLRFINLVLSMGGNAAFAQGRGTL